MGAHLRLHWMYTLQFSFTAWIQIFLSSISVKPFYIDESIFLPMSGEFVRRLGIGFLYIQLENNFCSQAFQIDLAVSLFPCFYILTFASNENNPLYFFLLCFFFFRTWNIMCLFCFVLKIPHTPPPKPAEKDQSTREMKTQFCHCLQNIIQAPGWAFYHLCWEHGDYQTGQSVCVEYYW